MSSRRSFLIGSALTAAASSSAVGANERIRVGFIGAGSRGSYMATVAEEFEDCQILAMCDVYKPTLEKAAAGLKVSKPETYGDYRRVLERKDLDAVYIATPDHWHAQMIIEASQAGKDIYCEKPLSNNIEAGWKAVETAKSLKRVVQIGLQQRSWDHFQRCYDLVQSGMFGTIFHCQLHWQGFYTPRTAVVPAPVPEGLDWELFQGPAERHPYSTARRNWRSFYTYGGGIITDQGVHIADVVAWYMHTRAPISVSGSGQYVQAPVNLECPPDSFQISAVFDKFVLSHTNAYFPQTDYLSDQGNYFYGSAGALHINRQSYTYRLMPGRTGGGARGSAAAPPPPFEPFNTKFAYIGKPSDSAHIRNWLDCIKSRGKTLTDPETGFYSTLPLLMGLLAIRNGKTYTWDENTHTAKA